MTSKELKELTKHMAKGITSNAGESPVKRKKTGVNVPKDKPKGYLHMLEVLKRSGLPFKTEHEFSEDRKFRFDFAIPELFIYAEYEGVFSKKSRHTSVMGFSEDCRKYSMAAVLGWRGLRYTAVTVEDFENDLNAIK